MSQEAAQIRDVNTGLGDDMSRMLYKASKMTLGNRPGFIGEVGGTFSSFRAIDGDYLGDMRGHWMQLGLDGVGTKVEIAERTGIHNTVGIDLFAMVCDDASVRGGEPLGVGSILDVRNLYNNANTLIAMQQLCEGYIAGAGLANVVVLNGELAELGGRVDGYVDGIFDTSDEREENRFNYNWGAVVLWDVLKDRVLDGSKVSEGDYLVGLQEPGMRSNGLTDVRKAMLEAYGPRWHQQVAPEVGRLTLGQVVRTPSTIYCTLINELTGGRDPEKTEKADIHGVAHITGGGQPEKLRRMLEVSGLGAEIYDPIKPPKVMTHVQELRGMSDGRVYEKFHMGPGMVIATPEPDKVVAEAEEKGYSAKTIGQVIDEPVVRIKNEGANQTQEWLEWSTAA